MTVSRERMEQAYRDQRRWELEAKTDAEKGEYLIRTMLFYYDPEFYVRWHDAHPRENPLQKLVDELPPD